VFWALFLSLFIQNRVQVGIFDMNFPTISESCADKAFQFNISHGSGCIDGSVGVLAAGVPTVHPKQCTVGQFRKVFPTVSEAGADKAFQFSISRGSGGIDGSAGDFCVVSQIAHQKQSAVADFRHEFSNSFGIWCR